MLPSKGYFRSIDCPFYKNNLCHRFYCHFRHNKKESLSPDSDTIDMISCDDNPEINQVVLKGITKQTIPGKQNSDINHTTIDEKNEAANVTIEINKNRVYSLPTDIPQYNPTPISELKTRHKQIISKSDAINSSQNQIKKGGTGKDANLIETLVGYFIENNGTVNKPIQINEIENTVELEIKDTQKCADDKLDNSVCSTNVPDSTSVQNGFKENVLPLSSINSIVQENMKLKEMISQLKNMESLDKPNSKTEVLDNQTLLEDLMGTDNNIESKSKLKKVNTGSTDITFQKGKYMNCEKTYSKRYEPSQKKLKNKHKSEKKLDNTTYKRDINKRYIKTVRKPAQIREHSKHNLKNGNCNTSGKINKGITKGEIITNDVSDSEIILISDSDDVDDCTVIDRNIEDEFDKVSVKSDLENLPEPKRKIRISHFAGQNPSSIQCAENPYFPKTYATPNIESENVYQAPKQKVRLAHKLNYNTLSVQSLQDHVSHWENVKERVKSKCINPSGEAGYQNWSKVKISPVPNVTSLMNSKKLLYSKIHQWKSKTKF